MEKMIFLALTPKEADALWIVANDGRNDFLCDPMDARIYLGRYAVPKRVIFETLSNVLQGAMLC
jgi:hypothetical protein